MNNNRLRHANHSSVQIPSTWLAEFVTWW